jgi:hypothetical protein
VEEMPLRRGGSCSARSKRPDLTVSSLTKVTFHFTPNHIEHDLLVLKQKGSTENQYKRVGLMKTREGPYYQNPELWAIKTLTII